MKYLLDSNIFIYAAAGVEEALRAIDTAQRSEWSGYLAISRLEVLGYQRFCPDEEQKLQDMLDCFEECDVTRAVIDKAVKIRRNHHVKVPDALISACACLREASLITRNKSDFGGIDELSIVNPFIATDTSQS